MYRIAVTINGDRCMTADSIAIIAIAALLRLEGNQSLSAEEIANKIGDFGVCVQECINKLERANALDIFNDRGVLKYRLKEYIVVSVAVGQP